MNLKTIAASLTILVVTFISAWTARRIGEQPVGKDSTEPSLIIESLPTADHVDNRVSGAALEPDRVLLQWDTYVGAPHAVLLNQDLYISSSATSSIGELYRFDRGGALVDLYDQRGHGPAEIAEPAWLQVLDNEVFISERNKTAVHVFDRDLIYREKLMFHATGKIVAATDQWLARWLYHRFEQQEEAGIMLTIHDRKNGRPLQQLVPVDMMTYAVTLDGGAVHHGNFIYAVSANSGCLDVIDTRSWASRRFRLRSDLAPNNLERWRDWSRRRGVGRAQVGDIEQWLGTFTRPIGISVVEAHLVLLYARGQNTFFDLHRLDGTPLLRNQRVNIQRPFLTDTNLVAIADIGDQQEMVYLDLAPIVRQLTGTETETN